MTNIPTEVLTKVRATLERINTLSMSRLNNLEVAINDHCIEVITALEAALREPVKMRSAGDEKIIAQLQAHLDELEMCEDANSGAEEGSGFGKDCVLLKMAIRRIRELSATQPTGTGKSAEEWAEKIFFNEPDYKGYDRKNVYLVQFDSLVDFIRRIQVDARTSPPEPRNGWQLVPCEPTEAMAAAGQNEQKAFTPNIRKNDCMQIYKVMCAASPTCLSNEKEICGYCNGTGKGFSPVLGVGTCSKCKGSGNAAIIKPASPPCGGGGK